MNYLKEMKTSKLMAKGLTSVINSCAMAEGNAWRQPLRRAEKETVENHKKWVEGSQILRMSCLFA